MTECEYMNVCACVCVCVCYWDPARWVQRSVLWMTKLINFNINQKIVEIYQLNVKNRWKRSLDSIFPVKKVAADLHIILHLSMDISSQGWFSGVYGSSKSFPSLQPGVPVPAFRSTLIIVTHLHISYRELCGPHRNGLKYCRLSLKTQKSGLHPLCEISAWDLWGNVGLY